MIVDIRVCGIPAQAKITHYHPGCSARTWGDPADCYPAEDEEIEFDLLDRRGRRAKWLEDKMVREGMEDDVTEAVLKAMKE